MSEMQALLAAGPAYGTMWTKSGRQYHTLAYRERWEANSRARRWKLHRNRQAFAAAARRLGDELGIDVEQIARHPTLYAGPHDHEEWLKLADRTYRSSHGTGDKARAAYHRSMLALWRFVFGPDRSLRVTLKARIVWD